MSCDRRHIQDRDVWKLRQLIQARLNLEMANTPEILGIALKLRPDIVCIVPERRQEITTEGGLDVVLHSGNIDKSVRQLVDAGIDVSIFVDPDLEQLRQCQKLRAPKVEINTGKYAEAWKRRGGWAGELEKVAMAAKAARKMGMVVLAGHGLDYRNIDGIAVIADIEELNIGHSIVARAVFVGFETAVREMLALMENYKA